MPEIDGLALLTHARRVAPQIPVVIVTAYGSTETARQAREAGAAAYLAKPFGVSRLRDVVARILSASPARAGWSGPAAGSGPTPPG
jgi:DNA-binding NtrC family response regulator